MILKIKIIKCKCSRNFRLQLKNCHKTLVQSTQNTIKYEVIEKTLEKLQIRHLKTCYLAQAKADGYVPRERFVKRASLKKLRPRRVPFNREKLELLLLGLPVREGFTGTTLENVMWMSWSSRQNSPEKQNERRKRDCRAGL